MIASHERLINSECCKNAPFNTSSDARTRGANTQPARRGVLQRAINFLHHGRILCLPPAPPFKFSPLILKQFRPPHCLIIGTDGQCSARHRPSTLVYLGLRSILMPPNCNHHPDGRTAPQTDSDKSLFRFYSPSHQTPVNWAHIGVSPLLANFSFCAPETLSLSMNSLSNSHDSRRAAAASAGQRPI